MTRFLVRRSFLDNYDVHQVGGQTILEYWIPAEDLAALNASIVGPIEVTAEFHCLTITSRHERKLMEPQFRVARVQAPGSSAC